jgi:hypothetical protein
MATLPDRGRLCGAEAAVVVGLKDGQPLGAGEPAAGALVELSGGTGFAMGDGLGLEGDSDGEPEQAVGRELELVMRHARGRNH